MTDSTRKSVFLVGMSTPRRDGLDARLKRSGISSEHFCGAGPCREALGTRPCHLLVIDLDGDNADALQLLGDSEPTVARIPTLVLVDRGDIPTAVQAIRKGAASCLERPLDAERLLAEIKTLLRQFDRDDHPLESALTPMETTVLHLILEGKTNHDTAQALHRSPRPTEVHRNHIMRKLEVDSMVDLVRRCDRMGLLRAWV